MLAVDALQTLAYQGRQVLLQLGVLDPQVAHGLVGQDVGQPAAHGLLDALIGVLFQVLEPVAHPGSQRRIDLHGQLSLRRIIAGWEDNGLQPLACHVELAGGGHHLGRRVGIDGQGNLDGVGQPTSARCGAQHDPVDVQDGHRPLDLDFATGRHGHPLRAAVDLQALRLQGDRGIHRGRGIVVHHHAQGGPVADDKKARGHGAHQQIERAQHVHRALADQGIGRHAAPAQAPGGQVVGQFDLHRGSAAAVGAHDGVPVGRVDKARADQALAGHGHAAAPLALRFDRQLGSHAVDRWDQRGRGANAYPARPVKVVDHGDTAVAAGQGQHGQVDQVQGELGLDTSPGVIGHPHVIADALARRIVLPGPDVAIGGQGHVQRPGFRGHRQGDIAQLERGQGIAFVDPLDQRHRDVHVGHVGLHDGQANDLAVAFQGDHPIVNDLAPFDGQQSFDRPAERRGHQDLGGIADLVFALVGDQLDAVIVLAAPTDPLVTADPEIGGRADLVPALVAPRGPHLVRAPFLGRKDGLGLSLGVGANGGRVHGGILNLPLPVPPPVGALFLCAVPAALHKDELRLLAGDRFSLQVDHLDVDDLLFAHLAHVAARGQPDVKEPLVHRNLGAVADRLLADIGDGHLQGISLAV